MTSVLAALHDPAWQRLGMALIHFVWQGLLIAAAYQLWIEVFRVRSAERRYLGGLVALALMTVCPVVTWAVTDVRHDLLSAANQTLSEPSRFGADDEAVDAPASRQIISWIVAGWLAGVTALSARVGAGLLGVCWLMRRGAKAPPTWGARTSELCRLLGLRTVPHIVVSTEVYEALAAGFFRPFIVVPSAWLLELPADVLEAVLAHELAHIRRWDLWVNLAQRIVESLLFYHPAVWWLSQSIRTDREMCCDELAVSATQQRVTYVSALETVARRVARPHLSPLTIGMGGVKMALLDRVRNVLGIGATARGAVWWPVSVLLIGICLALWMNSGRGPAPLKAADSDRPAVADDQPDGYGDPRDDNRPRGELAHWAPPPRRGPPPDDGPPRERGLGDRPPREAELLRAIHDLHEEVAELRRDVREIRDRRPPPPPPEVRALINSLPRDEYGRPTWVPPDGQPPRDRRPADGKRAESNPDGRAAEPPAGPSRGD